MMDVEDRRDACWKRIIDEQIVIPAHSIKLFDSEGNNTGRLLYSNHTVTLEHNSADSLDALADSTSPPKVINGDQSFNAPDNLSAHETLETSITDLSASNLVPTSTSTLATEDSPESPNAGHTWAENASADGQTEPSIDPCHIAETCPLNKGTGTSREGICSSIINLNLENHSEGLKTSVGNSIQRLL